MDSVYWCNGHELLLPEIVRARGCRIEDANGRRYVDLEAGVWCVPLGHNHPRVNRALARQLNAVSHTGYCYSHPVVGEAAAAVLALTGLRGGRCVFLSSGSEAVEFGVQALRTISGKPLLLTLADSFLGSYGSAGKKRAEEWHLFDWTGCADCARSATCDPLCPRFAAVPFANIGGFVFEPGSAGGMVRFPPAGLIQALAAAVRAGGGFTQINEITTGMGRTGKWFGFQHYGLAPDIVSLGKGLGNGYPVSAIALAPAVVDRLDRASFYYGQSHQNDPLGAAVAREVIAEMTERGHVNRSQRLGDYLKTQLARLPEKHPSILEVRGRGLLIAVELRPTVSAAAMEAVFRGCLAQGYIIARRRYVNVFRIDPPFVVTKAVLDGFIKAFDQSLGQITRTAR